MRPATRRIARDLLVALVVQRLLEAVLVALEPRWDEPLALRWLRAAALHPVRTPLAATLVAAGLRGLGPRPPAVEDPEGDPRASDLVDFPLPFERERSRGPPSRSTARPDSAAPAGRPALMTIAELISDVVRGPEELPGVGRVLLVEPTQETARPGRYPTQAVVVTAAARRIIELSKAGERLDAVVVRGQLDPTRHPDFREISENLRELGKKWFPKAQLVLLADRPFLEDGEVAHALHVYDRPIVRVEAGTQKTYGALTGDDGKDFKVLVEALQRLEHRNLTVRASFVRGDVENATDNELRAWTRYLAAIRPKTVRISTPAKARDGRRPVTKTRLGQIEAAVAEKVGGTVEVVEDDAL